MPLKFNILGFDQYSGEAIDAANRYGVPVDLFLRQITQESKWNADATSPTGVRGIAQFTKATAQDFGIDRLNPVQALDAAAKYDAQNYKKFGDWGLAFAAYNAGPGNVSKYGSDFSKYPDPKQVSGYVSNIMSTGKTGIPALDSALEGANRFLAESLSQLGAAIGKVAGDGVVGDILGRNTTSPGPIQNGLEKAGKAVEDGIFGPLKAWIEKSSTGIVLGTVGIVLILGALMIFAGPVVVPAAKAIAREAV